MANFNTTRSWYIFNSSFRVGTENWCEMTLDLRGPEGVVIPAGGVSLEDWFVTAYLPTLPPARVQEIMGRLAARRLGGHLPGPLTPPPPC